MGRQHLLLSIVKPPTLLNMKEWRLGWEHKLFLAILIASQVIGVLSYQKRFDCRFFIFHPECRGQYGKRSTLPALAQHQPNESQIPNPNDPNLDFGPEMEDLQMKNLLTYCSRYVFAPICRGVTSKRATVSPLVGNNHAIYDLILRQIKKQQEETKSDTMVEPSNLTPSEQANEDAKEIEDDFQRSQEGFDKRSSWDLNDLGPGFTSFYRKRLYKRQAPHILDDLDTFTSFIKKKRANNVPDDLGLFTTFYKRDAGGNHFSNARYRREALENLGAFTTFMKKNKPFNEAAPSIGKRSSRHSREALLDSLGTFSSFMSPHQYYKRTPISSHVGSSPIG